MWRIAHEKRRALQTVFAGALCSGISRLRVSDAVAEAVLAHTQGLTYNVYGLFDQKAEAPGDISR